MKVENRIEWFGFVVWMRESIKLRQITETRPEEK